VFEVTMQRLAISLTFLLPVLVLTPGCNKKGGDSTSPGLGTASGRDFADASPGDAKSSSRAEARADGNWDRGRPGEAGGEAAPSSPPSAAGSWDAGADFEADAIAREETRQGLGTAYGETRHSNVETVGFRRADSSTPDVVFAIRYDDVGGVRAAARDKRSRAFRDQALQTHAGISFALLDDAGNVLPAASVGSDLWAVGEPEVRYSLAIANDTASAFEVVASVDGLDIIDGRPASFAKRGYIVDPFSSVVIDGWRTSEETVAAFRFSSIEDSYSERMGDGRNVGVIGAAFFRQAPREWEEWRSPEETWRRDRADPFPGR
jgi:hypothetical protein